MEKVKIIEAPLSKDAARELKAGDIVYINGEIYAARDAAHKLMIGLINEGKDLPLDIQNQIIYYVGPCPARPGEVIGSAGPTTSSRMDAYAPKLIELGLTGMIGKGLRSSDVVNAMKAHCSVYFGAIGGAGALIAKSIIKEEIIAFPELGPEALRKLTVKDFPATVIIDCEGNSLYDSGKAKFRSIKADVLG
ncbi:MAG: Fe-S-containing hydro-lyase [Clostridia bacterium]|nr:Fe-S-containing hydro-lyase [Clostridia bacterium]